MRGYNIYHKGLRVNNKPITKDELAKARKQGYIYKKERFSTELHKYEMKNCEVVEVIIL